MKNENEGKTSPEDLPQELAARRRFLKMTGTLTALLPMLGLPTFTACAAVQRPTGPSPLAGRKLGLWYDTPAVEANVLREGLPIGNGRLGALVGGDPTRDFLYLTDGSMWLGGRNASLDGNGQFGYATSDFGSLVMLAKLYLSVDGHEFSSLTDYRRELDLSNGYVRVSYKKDGVAYVREIFASHPDDIVVVHLSQSGGGVYSGAIDLQGTHNETTHGDAGKPFSYFSGTLDNGLKYAATVKAVGSSGKVASSGSTLRFDGCKSLTVVFCGGTNYTPNLATGYMDPALDPLTLATRKVDAALKLSSQVLLRTHVADHRGLFDAMSVDLGASSNEQRGMDSWTRLQARAEAGAAADPELEATYLQFGRYLTIVGSRDKLPTGLQGLWLSDNASPWMADYHSDINIQMNYWLPDRAGLSSCFDALATYCLDQFDSWTALTQQFFNDPSNGFRNSSGKLAGWTLAISTNIYGGNGWWWHPAGSAWLCNSLYQHYQYVPDRDYLTRIYPLLKGACQFWEARLLTVNVTDPATGLKRDVLIDDSDWSPEQGPTNAKGITYAQELVWDLFENYRQASRLLRRDADYAATIGRLQARLYLPQISSETGWLEEWMTPDNLGETTHRHLSPLIGFFPGDRINTDTSPPALIDGVTRLLEARGMTGYGWGCAWRAICWARLKNADNAYQLLLTNLLPSKNHGNGTSQNFFDFYKLDENSDAFQIDANFGTPTAMLEMLLYSRPGSIELLPALPKAWAASGSVSGIGARGGFKVDLRWRDGKIMAVTVHSVGGTQTTLKYGAQSKTISLQAGESITVEPEIG
ncbi:alpha-L-fucosidase 2 [Luteibacter rhizovicinus]|uniref:Alpha-L-fucosidase 2 n=1 Tax=Luteibacter rhizovicinus TaxID=242606 RepID=A0A4R3YMA1_9GAMM|nr:glycoside hydrolase N-terminal domain-containing protein [Luteibacter rhizovicinus]TCV93391.1 alpha-L-fucosidase 2 [Luteibacter rhizovicinus]